LDQIFELAEIVGRLVLEQAELVRRLQRHCEAARKALSNGLFRDADHADWTWPDGAKRVPAPHSESEGFTSQLGPERSRRRIVNPKDSPASLASLCFACSPSTLTE
jgi:hypothetical protein